MIDAGSYPLPCHLGPADSGHRMLHPSFREGNTMTNAVPRHRKRIATATTLTAVAAFVTASIALAAPSNADSGATTTLAGTTPGYATASADLGQTGAAAPLSLRVYLAGQDPAGLEAYARAVSDPSSAGYKHFLS